MSKGLYARGEPALEQCFARMILLLCSCSLNGPAAHNSTNTQHTTHTPRETMIWEPKTPHSGGWGGKSRAICTSSSQYNILEYCLSHSSPGPSLDCRFRCLSAEFSLVFCFFCCECQFGRLSAGFAHLSANIRDLSAGLAERNRKCILRQQRSVNADAQLCKRGNMYNKRSRTEQREHLWFKVWFQLCTVWFWELGASERKKVEMIFWSGAQRTIPQMFWMQWPVQSAHHNDNCPTHVLFPPQGASWWCWVGMWLLLCIGTQVLPSVAACPNIGLRMAW